MTAKPIVLMDMDGPLADFDKYFWQQCQAQGWDFDCEPHEQSSRWATDHLTNPVARKLARSMVDTDPMWFYNLPPVPGAIEGMNILAKHAEVWICTKPLEANHTCRDMKAKWVREHLGSKWERRLIIAPDKSVILGNYLVDDSIKPHWFERATWTPIVYKEPFNEADLPEFLHWDWSDGVDVLIEWVTTWQVYSKEADRD